MSTEERVLAILTKIAEMQAEGADMTEALTLLGVTINGEE